MAGKFFSQKITILVSIPRFLIANIPNPALKKFVLDLKKYFYSKKWFFRSKKVKISRFFVETDNFGPKNRVFQPFFTLGKCPFSIF